MLRPCGLGGPSAGVPVRMATGVVSLMRRAHNQGLQNGLTGALAGRGRPRPFVVRVCGPRMYNLVKPTSVWPRRLFESGKEPPIPDPDPNLTLTI